MQLDEEQKIFVLSRISAADWTTFDLHASNTHTTYPYGEPLSLSERSALEHLFKSRQYAIRAGISIRDEKFSVHQWENTRGMSLVYGRRGDAISGCGACVCRAVLEDGREVYCAITYKFPSVSANAVSKLSRFVELLGKLAQEDLQTQRPVNA